MLATAIGAVLLGSAVAAPAKYWHRGGRSRGSCVPQFTFEALPSTGVEPDGKAYARYRQDDQCRFDFKVQVHALPVGEYALVVGGTARGTITVRETTIGTRGAIEFESGDDDSDELPLDFDPLGAVVEIRSGATVHFVALFDGGADASGGTPTPTRTAVPTDVAATRTRGESRTPTAAATRSPARTRSATAAATTTAVGATPTRIADATVRVRCERRAGRSRISVDGNNLPGGSYRARVTSGGASATSGPMPSVGDEVEFDFDSNPNDVAAGATAIAPGFIQGTPAQVIGEILDSVGSAVGSTTVTCEVR